MPTLKLTKISTLSTPFHNIIISNVHDEKPTRIIKNIHIRYMIKYINLIVIVNMHFLNTFIIIK